MTTSIKPILHNGFEIKDGITVKNRIERVFFTDVYKLSDNSFFYLLLNIQPNEINDRRGRYEMIRIEKDRKEWIGLIVREHSVGQLSDIVKNLTTI